MTILLALIGAIVGGISGAAIGFFGIIAIGTLLGADNQQGALAMGAATAGLPVGAVIGTILGGVLVIKLRAGAAPDSTWLGQQGLIALGIVGLGAAAFWAWFHWTGEPAQFSGGSQPVLMVEIRVPANDPGIEHALQRGSDLRSGEVYQGADGGMSKRREGDYAILSTRHVMTYKTDDRSVELWLGQERLLVFTLDLPRKPQAQADFSDWHRVDEVRPNFYGNPIPTPEGGHDIFIRTRVTTGQP